MGSAITATIFGAGRLPASSRRSTAIVDAEGAVTTSLFTTSGTAAFLDVLWAAGTGSAANGIYCSTPSATTTTRRLPASSDCTGPKIIVLKRDAAAGY